MAGFIEDRAQRKNHDQTKVSQLLAVPRYADLLESADTSEDEGEQRNPMPQSALVKSHAGWRKGITKWIREEQARDDSDDDELANLAYGHQRSKWLPRSLELLFGGQKEVGIDEQMRRAQAAQRRQAFTEEARLMELLVNEELDEERFPHDRELEGSGDDFDD